MKLEVVPLAVENVDRSVEFYRDHVGFHLDHDVEPGNGMRVVQLTPPGSACSIVFGIGITDPDSKPGSVRGLHLIVANIDDAREQLALNEVGISDVVDMGGVKYAFFSDPDGNSWQLQEWPPRSE